jgi:glycolate dehydrogenase FAD-binding subunit
MEPPARSAHLTPRDEADVVDLVRTHPRPLEPLGGGSKRAIGRPVIADTLDLSGLSGIVNYEPDELVLTARAATPLADIDAALNAHAQHIGFEPPDYGALLGVAARPTLGGVLAANQAGSRRIAAGAARDSFLGFRAVTGRGECFKAGGRVVKNVTGYDLPKLLAGSWGTLAVLTEVTIRVTPRPETETTLLLDVDTPERAVEVLTAALGSAHEISGAAYDPWRGAALRIEGFEASVAARRDGLRTAFGTVETEILTEDRSRTFWTDLAAARACSDWRIVWRISIPPSHAPAVVAALAPQRYLLDWGGGLIWAAFDGFDAPAVRGALRAGHATLIKAPVEARARTCTFPPLPAALEAVTARVKAAFDPDDRLNPRRMD